MQSASEYKLMLYYIKKRTRINSKLSQQYENKDVRPNSKWYWKLCY